ncbi:alpha/beta fold hydrolase [uncultured Kordia sp.]|uniref:alpha/beta hydrolase n=1 Tax=uncultured Kordia sp. TaxID=507699 RepID=UPI0026299F79|nr:alpha/beta fold hydrolase [uncultured Kordia sp.]
MKKKLLYLLLGLLIFVGIASYVLAIHIAPYAIIQPQRINLAITPKSLNLESETLAIQVEDSIQLKGYWVKSNTTETKGIMILLHGIGGCKEHFLGLAGNLANKGIASIVFDGRAHGESGGKYCTYGFYEKKDISKIVDFIKQKNPKLSVGIWGNSLGGAIAIQALEHDKRIEFGVIESTFTELNQTVYDYQKKICKGIGVRFITDAALQEAGKIANFIPDEVKPVISVANIQQPIFIGHGDNDENIHYTYGEQLYENLASAEKEFVLVKDAGHFDVYAKGGKNYENKLLSFIKKQLK